MYIPIGNSNYLGTNWISILYTNCRLPEDFPDNFGKAPDTFQGWRNWQVAVHRSWVPGPVESTTIHE